MKRNNIIIAFFMIIIIAISSAYSVCIPVYAAEHGGGGSSDHVIVKDKTKVKTFVNDYFTNVADFWLYAAMQVGAVFVNKFDFSTFAENYKTMDSIINEENDIGIYEDTNGNVIGLYLSKEFMTQLKVLIDQYAKENEPYFIVRIPSYKEVNPSQFATKGQYLTICNLAKKYGLIGVNGLYMSDLSEVLNGNYSYVNDIGTLTDISLLDDYYVVIYDDGWDKYEGGQRYKFDFPAGTSVGYESIEDGEKTTYSNFRDFHSDICLDYVNKHNGTVLKYGTPIYTYEHIRACLISRDGFRDRIYKSINDFKNYSVGNRKVYFTKDYYDYEPEDLTASIDDLQKSVDELQKIIDELLKKIDDLTSESDIEDLLRQILEALRNQQSSGGGGGSGSGDVTVNIDLSTTNNWLSKIYSKVSQISDKISATAGQSMSEVVESIENLQKMLTKYLKEITGDLDDIKGQLEEMTEQEFSDKTESFLDDSTESFSEIAEVAKTKFPLSIPNDLYNLMAVISPKQPEPSPASIYTNEQVVYNGQALPVYEGNGKLMTIRDGTGSGSMGMSATGAPVFNLPIIINSVGWDYTIIVDLSQFQTVADLSRTLFTIIFILGMIKLSILVIGLWGDIVD